MEFERIQKVLAVDYAFVVYEKCEEEKKKKKKWWSREKKTFKGVVHVMQSG